MDKILWWFRFTASCICICRVTHSTKQAFLFQFQVQSLMTTELFKCMTKNNHYFGNTFPQNAWKYFLFDIYTKLDKIQFLKEPTQAQTCWYKHQQQIWFLYKVTVSHNLNQFLDYQKKLPLVEEKSLKIEVEHLIIINNCSYLT